MAAPVPCNTPIAGNPYVTVFPTFVVSPHFDTLPAPLVIVDATLATLDAPLVVLIPAAAEPKPGIKVRASNPTLPKNLHKSLPWNPSFLMSEANRKAEPVKPDAAPTIFP